MEEQDTQLRERIAKLEGWFEDKDKRIREIAREIDEVRKEAHAHDDRICDEFRSEDRTSENRMTDLEIRLTTSMEKVETRLDDRIDATENDLHNEMSKISSRTTVAIIVGATLLAAVVSGVITALVAFQ